MNTTRTLALAAVAALSLGVGSAMARTHQTTTYQTQPQEVAPQPAPQYNNQVQSGSSDVNGSRYQLNTLTPAPDGGDGGAS